MSYIENARNLLNTLTFELDKEHGLGWVRGYRNIINNYNIQYNTNYKVRNGAVRVVIIGEDFVIKVDYNKNNAKDFGGCEQEYRFWQKIKNTEHAHLFAPITKMKAGHHFYYVMPRMDYLAAEDDDLELSDRLDNDEYEWLVDTIRDLHENNYGILDDDIYIIDYACYF